MDFKKFREDTQKRYNKHNKCIREYITAQERLHLDLKLACKPGYKQKMPIR
jgi:hypothetical protein